MILELDGISHRYGEEVAVRDVSLGVESGELVALLGPSGCGKTTIVQSIAGHIHPTSGRVFLRGEDVTGEPPESREIGLMFQRSTLYPHMTVAENVAYGLAPRNIAREGRREIVATFLDLVDLADQREAYPKELSGGQRRRAELARALAPEPDMLLLDEPLSGLDRALRERLQQEIIRIQRETGVTTLFVTHDQEEAMTMADRLVVMTDGEVSGIGTPRALYESPPTAFIASFLGRSNTLQSTVVDTDPVRITLGGRDVPLAEASLQRGQGDSVSCHVRPDQISLNGDLADPSLRIPGEVVEVADIGRRYDVTVRLESDDEVLVEHTGHPPSVGEVVDISLSEQDLVVFGE